MKHSSLLLPKSHLYCALCLLHLLYGGFGGGLNWGYDYGTTEQRFGAP